MKIKVTCPTCSRTDVERIDEKQTWICRWCSDVAYEIYEDGRVMYSMMNCWVNPEYEPNSNELRDPGGHLRLMTTTNAISGIFPIVELVVDEPSEACNKE